LGNANGTGICHSYTPDGRCVSLLKILLTNHCIYDCQYCVNRVSNDVRRARFTVDEVVNLTLDFYRRNYIEGLFLSSGVIRDPDYTMSLLGQVVKKLRTEHYYAGYIHLKAVVGASPEAVAAAGVHADRLSANIELPTQPELDRLAPGKSVKQTEDTMAGIRTGIEASRQDAKPTRSAANPTKTTSGPARFRRGSRPTFAPAGQSTQMVVGACPSPDADILQTADRLYRRHRLRRVYYSAYTPIPNAPAGVADDRPPLMREHRLYQADWLLRFYGFRLDEIVGPTSNLDLEIDPKLAWALRHRALFPIDINRDPKELLLRVPGLGVRNVQRILSLRRLQSIKRTDLRKLRVAKRAWPFLVTADPAPDPHLIDKADLRQRIIQPQQQPSLFAAAHTARTGEL
jgi:putative DNA modification/repair radical SAM protein